MLAARAWLLFGPRRRASTADLGPFQALPLFWLGYPLVGGAWSAVTTS